MPHPTNRLVETSPPASEPLTLSEVKTYLRVDHSSDDALLTELIAAARQTCESATGRSLITRGYSLFLDYWPSTALLGWWDGVREGANLMPAVSLLDLPQPPLAAVGKINVYDADGAASEYPAANYFTDAAGIPGRIVLKEGSPPPQPGRGFNGIEIQFTAGYGASGQNVPAALRQGMKQMVAHLYEHRGDSAVAALRASGAAALFQPFRPAGLS